MPENVKASAVGSGLLNLLLLAAGIVAVVYAARLGVGSLRQPGAGLFPMIAGVTILAADVVLMAGGWRGKAQDAQFACDRTALMTIASLVSVMAGWIVAMPYLGYVMVTFLGVCALARTFGLKGWRQPLLLAAFTSLAVYVLFDWLLFLDLPRGIFAPGE